MKNKLSAFQLFPRFSKKSFQKKKLKKLKKILKNPRKYNFGDQKCLKNHCHDIKNFKNLLNKTIKIQKNQKIQLKNIFKKIRKYFVRQI